MKYCWKSIMRIKMNAMYFRAKRKIPKYRIKTGENYVHAKRHHSNGRGRGC